MTKANETNETNKMPVSAGSYIESITIDLWRINLDLRNAKMYAESGGEIQIIKTFLKNALTGFHALSGRIGELEGALDRVAAEEAAKLQIIGSNGDIDDGKMSTTAKKIMDRKPDATKKTDTPD